MDAHTMAQSLRLDRMKAEPSEEQKFRAEVERKAPKQQRKERIVHPLEEKRVGLLLAERDLRVAWMR